MGAPPSSAQDGQSRPISGTDALTVLPPRLSFWGGAGPPGSTQEKKLGACGEGSFRKERPLMATHACDLTSGPSGGGGGAGGRGEIAPPPISTSAAAFGAGGGAFVAAGKSPFSPPPFLPHISSFIREEEDQ